MNPVERPFRTLVVLVVVTSVVFAVTAFAAMHIVNDFKHGITGPSCGPLLKNCSLYAENYDWDGTGPNAHLVAARYHYTSSGTWNLQCSLENFNSWMASCWANSGDYPCQKYAFTSGDDPGSALAWHGHNSATICA